MEENLIIENPATGKQNSADTNTENATQEKIAALELQLKIFKQAESIGEIGNWQINLNTFEAWYSDNIFRLYGLEPQAVAVHPDTFNVFIHMEDREVVEQAFEKSYKEKIPIHFEFRIIRQDGEERHVNIVSNITKNINGEPLLTGITQDITERKNLELALRQTGEDLHLRNESFRQAEKFGVFGTWQINLDTRQTHYSENFLRIFGLKPGFVPLRFDDLAQYVSPDDQSIFEEVRKKIFHDRQAPEAEFLILMSDGKRKRVRLKSKLLKNADGEWLVVGMISDITFPRALEKQLKDANDKLIIQNEIFNHSERISGVGSAILNLHTNETYYSRNIYNTFGLKPDSGAPGLINFLKYVHPDDRAWMAMMPEKLRAEVKEQEYNYRIIRPDGELRYLRAKNHPVTSPEGHTLIIGYTQDITEEVLLNQQLNERIRFAEMLSEYIVDKVVITNTSHAIIWWNKSSENAYQIKKEQILGKNFFEVFPKVKSPEVIERYNRVLDGESIHIPEIKLVYAEGYHELSMLPVRDENGNVIATLTILHDITEQHKLRKELAERIEFIENLVEASVHRISVLSRNLNYLYWNKKNEEHYHLRKQNVIGRNLFEVFPFLRTDPIYEGIKKSLKGETIYIPASEGEELLEHADAHLIPIKGITDEVIAVLWIVHDLTDLILAKQQVNTSEAHLRAAQEIALMGSYGFDLKTNNFSWSEQLYKIYDLDPGEEINLEKIKSRVHPDDVGNLSDVLEKVIKGETDQFEVIYRIITRDQKLKYIQTKGRLDKKLNRLIGSVQDITERKNAEGKLNETLQLLRQVTVASPDMIIVRNLETNETIYLNNVSESVVGFTSHELVEMGFENRSKRIHKEDRQAVIDYFKTMSQVTDDDIHIITYRFQHKNGRWIYLSYREKIMTRDANGKPFQILCFVQDITEQKRAEERTKEARELMQMAIDSSGASLDFWDMATGYTIWDERGKEIMGFKTSAEMISIDGWINRVHPDDREMVMEGARQSIETGRDFRMEYRVVHDDGQIKYVFGTSRMKMDEQGELKGSSGMMIDLTPIRKAEEHLKETAHFLKQISDVSPYLIGVTELKGNRLIFLNRAIEEFFGYSAVELEGMDKGTWMNLVHPQDVDKFNDSLLSAIESQKNEIQQVDFRVRRKDGVWRWLFSRVSVFKRDQEGIPTHLLLIAFDNTEKILAEENIIANKNLLQSILDSTTNGIAALKSIRNDEGMIVDFEYLLLNEGGETLLGRTDLVGKRILQEFPAIKGSEWFEKAVRVSETGGHEKTEFYNVQDGSNIWFHSEIVQFGDGCLGTFQDITDRKLAELELEESRLFIEKVSSTSPNLITVQDISNNAIVYANEEYLQLFASIPGFLELRPEARLRTMIHPDDHAATIAFMRHWNFLRNDEILQCEHRILTSPDHWEWFITRSKVFKQDKKGKPTQIISFAININEQKLAAEEVKKNRELLRSVFDAAINSVNVLKSVRNEKGEIIDFAWILSNKRTEQNAKSSELVGERFSEHFPGVLETPILSRFKEVVEKNVQVDFEQTYNREGFNGVFRIVAMKFGDGVIVSSEDITERKKAEQEIQKQQVLLQQAEEMAHLGSWEYNLETKNLFWSDEVFRLYGYSPQSFTPTLDFYFATTLSEDRENVKLFIEEAEKGKSSSVTHRLYTIDGRTRYVLSKSRPLRNPAGEVVKIIGSLQDLTELTKLEMEIRKKNSALLLQSQLDRQAQKIRNVGNWQWNFETGEMIWGENLFHLLGVNPYSLQPNISSFLELAHPDDQEYLRKQIDEFRQSTGTTGVEFEFRMIVKEEVRFIRCFCRLLKTQNGRTLIGSMMDITTDALLQKQLGERINFIETLIESSVDLIIAFDTEFRLLAWNKKAEETYGFTREQVIGKSFLELFPKLKDDPAIIDAAQTALSGTSVYVPVKKEIYAEVYLEGFYAPLRNKQGEIYGVLNIIHDVSQQIKAERDLEALNESLLQKNRQLQEMNEELNSFAFIASHDLREPLRKVQVFSNRIMQKELENLTKPSLDQFKRLLASVKRMDELIDDILNFSSINGSAPFALFDLNHVLEDVKTDLSDTISMSGAVIESAKLPMIEGTPSHFSHLFRNLLSNAIKYQVPGNIPRIVIESREINVQQLHHPDAKQGSTYLEISVSDNGIGFDQQYERKIFQMFQRLHGMHEYSGTGMGLSICKKVAEIYNGFITATSSVGKGARFNCYFRLKSTVE